MLGSVGPPHLGHANIENLLWTSSGAHEVCLLKYVEGALLIAALVLCWAKICLYLPEPLSHAFERFASRPWLATVTLVSTVVFLRLLLLPWMPIPQPAFQDEFSLLFGAKTFAMGRWTNPTHPMWTHFETFYILPQPTTMSMYPPAQAAALALGILAGNAWYAVLLMSALMVGAFVWMLRPWFSPSWAVIGGILLVPFAIFSYWTNSYWGGSLAALAAALMMGAASRTWQLSRPRARDVLIFAAGTAILMNRRPFEGSFLLLGFFCWMLYWGQKKMNPKGVRSLLRIAVLLSVVLLPCLAVIIVYNWKVTGSPLSIPYVKANQTYAILGHALWLPMYPDKTYRNAEFTKLFHKEADLYRERRAHPLSTGLPLLKEVWQILFGSFGLAFLALPWAGRSLRMRPIMLLAISGTAVICTETWQFPHYFAPVFPLLWILLIECIRYVWALPAGRGRALVVALLLSGMLLRPCRLLAIAVAEGYRPTFSADLDRQPVIASVSSVPGNHLILVKYLPSHSVNFEWVYNEPDIDASRIIWARSLSPEQDRELIRYFSGRHVWLVEVGNGPASVRDLGEAYQ